MKKIVGPKGRYVGDLESSALTYKKPTNNVLKKKKKSRGKRRGRAGTSPRSCGA